MARVHVFGVVGLVLAAAVTAGCSGSGATSGSGSSSSSGAASTTASAGGSGSSPAPTESNPPGDIPDNQAFVAYQPSGGAFTGFTVKVPEGWARTSQGGTTVFTDKLNRVRISAAATSSAPTVGSVTRQVVPRLRVQVPKFTSPKVSTVTRKAGGAVLLTYQGDSAANPVTGKVVRDAFERYAFYRQGHEVLAQSTCSAAVVFLSRKIHQPSQVALGRANSLVVRRAGTGCCTRDRARSRRSGCRRAAGA
ncbi:hypothetical protein [Streptomyces canus]|uniref:hypothetical protein n=1 Tax=Streptomyces canus TaxID=58343 RepID=UPI0022567E28|nr:hypothetical protein [Streptomyces canus]MCX4862170.1 hypothetical protein [Streptomyces canus]